MKLSGYLCALIGLGLASVATADVTEFDVTFLLYSPGSDSSIQLIPGQIDAEATNISEPIKCIIHGVGGSSDEVWVNNVKDAYLKTGNFSVIVVDWRKTAGSALWNNNDLKAVGNYISKLVVDLYDTLEVEASTIHMIGYGYGAHVAAFCGRYLKSQKKPVVGRITGLDPKEIFGTSSSDRLTKGDALSVDIIRTDFTGEELLGNADFYPNGGWGQPGCGLGNCHHRRAYEFFLESIASNGFVAKLCKSWTDYKWGSCDKNQRAVMGDHLDTSLQGRFYLKTNSQSPFAQGKP